MTSKALYSLPPGNSTPRETRPLGHFQIAVVFRETRPPRKPDPLGNSTPPESSNPGLLGLERVGFGSIWREAPEKRTKTVGKHTFFSVWRCILEIFLKKKCQKLDLSPISESVSFSGKLDPPGNSTDFGKFSVNPPNSTGRVSRGKTVGCQSPSVSVESRPYSFSQNRNFSYSYAVREKPNIPCLLA